MNQFTVLYIISLYYQKFVDNMGNVLRLTEAISKDSGANIGWVGTFLNNYVMGITFAM
jgi:hypothetical protein